MVAGGLQSVQRKLRGNVLGGDVASARAGAAALQQIAGQKFHVRANLLRIDGGHGMFGRREEDRLRGAQGPRLSRELWASRGIVVNEKMRAISAALRIRGSLQWSQG